jgi:hypothetical protein
MIWLQTKYQYLYIYIHIYTYIHTNIVPDRDRIVATKYIVRYWLNLLRLPSVTVVQQLQTKYQTVIGGRVRDRNNNTYIHISVAIFAGQLKRNQFQSVNVRVSETNHSQTHCHGLVDANPYSLVACSWGSEQVDVTHGHGLFIKHELQKSSHPSPVVSWLSRRPVQLSGYWR